MITPEITVSVIPGSDDRQRLVVVLCYSEAEGSRIELRQQSWGDGLGWFTQSSVTVEPHQLSQLRGSLGRGACGRTGASHVRQVSGNTSADRSLPRVVRAESA